MGIKVEKYVYKRTADIYLHRIDCTERNILKVLDMFTFKNIIVEISDVNKSDAIFEKIKSFELRYTTSMEDESPYIDLIFMANIHQLKDIVANIFETNAEIFFIASLDFGIQWEQYLFNRPPVRKLIKQGKVDLSISVAIQESTIAITLSKECYNTSMLTQKAKDIKKIF